MMAALLALGSLAGATSLSPGPGEEEISGFVRVLPRGAIPSIDRPSFVSARDAKIDPDSWVLGVVLEGQARAYSLNLLNHHEVVNDEIAGRPVAAVW